MTEDAPKLEHKDSFFEKILDRHHHHDHHKHGSENQATKDKPHGEDHDHAAQDKHKVGEDHAAQDKHHANEGGLRSQLKKDEERLKKYFTKDEKRSEDGQTYGGLM
ncbi:hypothetical protein CBS147339_8937 [Penicillium roqueforti]|uniref:Uncharacterized protein n=1 Tax=Penicillium roqueforti (strain FM164) TaxID=1365484 RepID=W6QMC1_PENRF|nr:uncharacterized protein LCP9604111_9696 [Penicillium roqueforti]CDM37580.1 unnamed protein product [Penicillium roqueforti FM164]KAF9237586.1 hypothetical protein LCP9604111_9696 [Penicillium roqueforti]KAI3065812.1 hypothetical protein CBS147339_8937 [Penicillium roqueforti]KAI3094988.1 hypothetical protein CBS147338_6054 [Penicillium roqueforti]KAI3118655.1 hypothetical protein CBS147330_8878 [Penicillium roqueforti]